MTSSANRSFAAGRGQHEIRHLAVEWRRIYIVANGGVIGMTAWLGDAGMALFAPGAGVLLAAFAAVRRIAVGLRPAWQVDRAIDLQAWRTAKGRVMLH
jgi:hypothetical protein